MGVPQRPGRPDYEICDIGHVLAAESLQGKQ
jgi:hypothetical protein